MTKKTLTPSALQTQARLGRRLLRRLRQSLRYQRRSFNGLPVLFANSFPKSGTHLLTQILQAFEEVSPAVNCGLPAVVTFQGDTARQRPVEQILSDLRRFLPGDIGYGHLHAEPPVVELLTSPAFAAYFVLRDPRDVVVSHVHYVAEMEPRHALHEYYVNELHTFEERLSASISGLEHLSLPLPNIRQRFAPFLGWLQAQAVLTLRYEDLMQDRQAQLQSILEHAVRRGLPIKCSIAEAVEKIETCINPQRSPTFRKGKIGGWRESFTAEHIRLFKEISGDILIRLGYEKDMDW
ncbi:MAG: sulfotransferase domain-containing protein [Chloroflexota bacterium]